MIYQYDEKKSIPFIGREKELTHTLQLMQSESSTRMFVSGKSGSGKTTLVKKAVQRLHEIKHGKINYVYLDAYENLISDLNAAVFEHILALTLFTMKNGIDDNITSFYYSRSFKSHIQKSNISLATIGQAIKNATAFIPNIGQTISSIMPAIDTKELLHLPQDYNLMQIIIEYLNLLSKECSTIFVIDNYQFLNGACRKIVDYMLNTIDNLFTVEIIRVKDSEDNKYRYNSSGVTLNHFTYDETKNLIKNVYKHVSETQIRNIYNDSNNGNLKDLESFIRLNKDLRESTVIVKYGSIYEQYGIIDSLKRDIGLLSSIFSYGIDVYDLINIMRSYSYWNDDKSLIMDALTDNPFVIYNSDTNIIKKGHERIISNLLETYEDEEYVNILNVAKDYVDAQILNSQFNNQERYIYLMNVILSIKTIDEIIDNTSILGNYLKILSNNYLYESIYYIYDKLIKDVNSDIDSVVSCLPIYCIRILLESFEKTSRFSHGLDFYNTYVGGSLYISYKIKYLLQSYNYKEAAKALINTDSIELKRIYLNLIQHERKDEVAKSVIDSLIDEEDKYTHNDDYYIILRNSGHLFAFDEARININKALHYFRNNKYYKATCLNNLGLVYLYDKNLEVSYKLFIEAKNIFEKLSSTEVYQPEFNIGLVYMLKNEYKKAEQYFINAIKTTPKSLIYDKVKFFCTLHVCRYLNTDNDFDISIALKKLFNLMKHYSAHPDPWLKLCLTINYYQIFKNKDFAYSTKILKETFNEYVGDANIYGLSFKKEYNDITNEFILAVSPHWRC